MVSCQRGKLTVVMGVGLVFLQCVDLCDHMDDVMMHIPANCHSYSPNTEMIIAPKKCSKIIYSTQQHCTQISLYGIAYALTSVWLRDSCMLVSFSRLIWLLLVIKKILIKYILP